MNTWDAYFAIDAVNWSLLKCMDESPLAYRHAADNDRPDLHHFRVGRYVHAQVLDPEHAPEQYAIWTGGDRRGADYRAFKEAHPHHVIFKPDEIADMDGMIAAIRAHGPAAALLSAPDARTEQIVTWTDPDTGIACKARPDLIIPSMRIVADLKTTRSIDVRRFGNEIARYGYHGQLVHYAAGIEHALGWKPERHVLIAVEKAPPYDVAVFDVADCALTVAREKVATLLGALKDCLDRDHWPGRYPEPVVLDHTNLPPWIYGGGPDIVELED